MRVIAARTMHSSPQAIFAYMVCYATPRLKAFQGDLYHDAVALSKRAEAKDANDYVALKTPFLWFVGDNGTHLHWLTAVCADSKLIESIAESYPAIYFYDGYTIAPIGLIDALSAARAVERNWS